MNLTVIIRVSFSPLQEKSYLKWVMVGHDSGSEWNKQAWFRWRCFRNGFLSRPIFKETVEFDPFKRKQVDSPTLMGFLICSWTRSLENSSSCCECSLTCSGERNVWILQSLAEFLLHLSLTWRAVPILLDMCNQINLVQSACNAWLCLNLVTSIPSTF